MTDTPSAAASPSSGVTAHTDSPQPPTQSVGTTVGKLSAVNVLLLVGGFATAPLQARALGPTGRGELAAISSTLSLAPAVASLGLTTYASRAVARGQRLGDVLGTASRIYLAVGVAIIGAALPLASALSGGHRVVREFLAIGFFTLPVALIGWLLLSIAIGLEKWDTVVATKFLTTMLGICPIVLLFALGSLTVSSAALTLICANVAFVVPLVVIMRMKPRPLRWQTAIAREGTTFGAKAWLGGVSSVTNGRIDQVLMISLVGPRQLGLYAVAVTMSTVFISVLSGALQFAIVPQVARGNYELIRQAARTTVAFSLASCATIALLSPLVLRYLFGPQFEAAEPMLLILLIGSLALALNVVLSAACSSGGHPGAAARAEAYALAITIPGLLLLLGPLGGVGAAIVSCLAYGFTDAYLLRVSTREFGGQILDYVLPRREDLDRLVSLTRKATARLRQRWAISSSPKID